MIKEYYDVLKLFNFRRSWCQAVRFVFIFNDLFHVRFKTAFPKICITGVFKKITLERKISHFTSFFSVSLCEKRNIFPITGNVAHCFKMCTSLIRLCLGRVHNFLIGFGLYSYQNYLLYSFHFYILHLGYAAHFRSFYKFVALS